MQYHDQEDDFLVNHSQSMRVVRTYEFKSGAFRKKALYCHVWFPDWPEDLNHVPAVTIQYELDEPSHDDSKLFNRLHVWTHWSIPSQFILDELSRFSQTLKQLYEL